MTNDAYDINYFCMKIAYVHYWKNEVNYAY